MPPGSPFGPIIDKPGGPGGPGGPWGPGVPSMGFDWVHEQDALDPGGPTLPGSPVGPISPLSPFSPFNWNFKWDIVKVVCIINIKKQVARYYCILFKFQEQQFSKTLLVQAIGK